MMSSLIPGPALGMVSNIGVIVNFLHMPEKIIYLYFVFILAKKFQPKIKPRPRVSNTPATGSASSCELPTFTDDKFTFTPVRNS
jgi:hypothetical protein